MMNTTLYYTVLATAWVVVFDGALGFLSGGASQAWLVATQGLAFGAVTSLALALALQNVPPEPGPGVAAGRGRDRPALRLMAAPLLPGLAFGGQWSLWEPLQLRHRRRTGERRPVSPVSPTPGPAPVATPVDGEPDVDWGWLDNRYRHRDAFIRKLAAATCSGHRETPGSLRAAAAGGDLAAIAFHAHTLRSVGGNLGAQPMACLATRTERAARAGEGDAAALADLLAVRLEHVLAMFVDRYGPDIVNAPGREGNKGVGP